MKTIGMILTVAVLATGNATYGQSVDGWTFEVTPYAWLAGLEGDATIKGQRVDFEKSASDLFDATELAGSLRMSATRDGLVLAALVDYYSLSTDELDAENQPPGVRFDSDMVLVEFMAGYRFAGWGDGMSVVVGAGLRNQHQDNEIRLVNGARLNDENDVTDGMLYLAPTWTVAPGSVDRLRFRLGLGIGTGDSDITYDVFPECEYGFAEQWVVHAGYRLIGWEQDGGGRELNTRMAGLVAGIGYSF